jgi:3D (Asp-Asp-Asp) domain-containing protein
MSIHSIESSTEPVVKSKYTNIYANSENQFLNFSKTEHNPLCIKDSSVRKHRTIMTENNLIFYGKCLSASLFCVAFTLLPLCVRAESFPEQHIISIGIDRTHWPAATKRAIGAFAELQDESIGQVQHLNLRGFILTAYTLDVESTGKSPSSPAFGITASGTHAKVGRTVAVDPSVIPIGSLLYIPSLGWRIAEDSGGAVKGRHIDILLPTRAAAMQFGVQHPDVVYMYQHEPESMSDSNRHST